MRLRERGARQRRQPSRVALLGHVLQQVWTRRTGGSSSPIRCPADRPRSSGPSAATDSSSRSTCRTSRTVRAASAPPAPCLAGAPANSLPTPRRVLARLLAGRHTATAPLTGSPRAEAVSLNSGLLTFRGASGADAAAVKYELDLKLFAPVKPDDPVPPPPTPPTQTHTPTQHPP